MSKLPIAVAIPTKNEGLNIAEAVKSVLGHFEAVVVVDSHSTDDTAKIAEECGAEVVTYTWDGASAQEAVVPGARPHGPGLDPAARR